MQHAPGPFMIANKRLDAYHLGKDETRSEFPADDPEREISDARHGSKHEGVLFQNFADRHEGHYNRKEKKAERFLKKMHRAQKKPDQTKLKSRMKNE
jgi:hypothetical protein